MDINWKALASLVLVSAFTVASAQTTATARKTHKATAKGPSVESQIEELRQEMEAQRSQIDSLKQQLSERDTALQQAQQAAASAQTAAQQAQAAAQSQQQAIDASNQTVNSLQGAVADLKTSTATIQSDQKKLVGQVEHPDEIHYKGITFSPHGSFIEAATVYRSAATGGGINTPFTGIPLDNANGAQLSEFYGSGRQSRLALKATGKLDSMKMTGYYEMDWLGTGITSNNNQSNSYVLRQRQLWAQAALNNGWTFTGGQMWSLATETTHGLDNGTEILPATIDPQYEAGFVWTRQYGFRVTKDFGNKFWVGASAENAETLNPAGSSLPTNLLLGSAGVGGGLYDSASNYSFNIAPDMIAKVAWEPGWGHYEVFGIARFFRDRIYPAGTTSVGAYNDTTTGGGIGASGRVPLFQNKLSLGLKGLYGMGVGRYGDSQIADITLRPDAQIAPLRGFSALSTLEANPTKRLMLYTNYGGDYIYRRYFGKVGYGSPLTNMSGCNTEPIPSASFTPNAPANCGGNNKDVQEFTVGEWYNFYDGPKGRLRLGLQYSYFWRVLWSGAGGTANPGGGAQGNDNVFETSFRYYVP
ncbi:MAG TPA: hypothetical protein VMA71_00645 [Alloacidobacterium sp.]|nr:hypothetical protein [Alloacidobacterium sp.]